MPNNKSTRRKFGRRPPKNAPALRLSHFLRGAIPQHPLLADYVGIGGWQMLGNDKYGDCVAVTWGNVRRLMTRLVGGEKYPTLTKVLDFYKTQNPGFPSEDNGMDIQTALETLVHTGGPDGIKAVAFAKVDHSDPDEVKAAIAIFGYIWVGINVQKANMQQFDDSEPWDYVKGSAVEGGHSIITGGYGKGQGVLGGDERFVTWAQETSFTDTFWSKNVEEAWVAIWPEHLTSKQFQQGIDLKTLAADYKQLTGNTLPVSPTPTPPPPAPPSGGGLTVSITDSALIPHITKSAARDKMNTDTWITAHLRKYFDLPAAGTGQGRAKPKPSALRSRERVSRVSRTRAGRK